MPFRFRSFQQFKDVRKHGAQWRAYERQLDAVGPGERELAHNGPTQWRAFERELDTLAPEEREFVREALLVDCRSNSGYERSLYKAYNKGITCLEQGLPIANSPSPPPLPQPPSPSPRQRLRDAAAWLGYTIATPAATVPAPVAPATSVQVATPVSAPVDSATPAPAAATPQTVPPAPVSASLDYTTANIAVASVPTVTSATYLPSSSHSTPPPSPSTIDRIPIAMIPAASSGVETQTTMTETIAHSSPVVSPVQSTTQLPSNGRTESSPRASSGQSVLAGISQVKREQTDAASVVTRATATHSNTAADLMGQFAEAIRNSEQQTAFAYGSVSSPGISAMESHSSASTVTDSSVEPVESDQSSTALQEPRRGPKRRHSRRKLLDLDVLKRQKLMLENLKLALELGLITRDECLEKGRRVVDTWK